MYIPQIDVAELSHCTRINTWLDMYYLNVEKLQIPFQIPC